MSDLRMLSRLLVINEVSAAALQHPSLPEIYRVVAESMVRHFSYFEASVFEVDRDQGKLVLVAQSPPCEIGREPPYSQPVEVGLLGFAVRERRSVLVNDVARDERYVPPPDRRVHCASELCAPVLKDGEVVAAIDVECREPNAFGESDRLALEAIANVVGMALHAAEVHQALERQLRLLREAQCQLVHSERLADVGRLTSRVAHEIRNPLSTIGGYARRIARQAELDQKTLRGADIIVEEVERLERLLSGVMDFARPGLPHKAPTDLNTILKRSISLCESARQGKQITITERLSPDLPQALADAEQIKQVFINVIKNAFDSIREQGGVTIVSRRAGENVVIRISDTGSGIDPEHLANIFDPFFTTKRGGTGLGLAVASKIVDDHGGHIVIGSELGKGTHVNIRLPTGQPTNTTAEAGPSAPSRQNQQPYAATS